MDFIISLFLFPASYILSLVYTSVIILAFFYAIPRAIKDVIKKRIKITAVFAYLIAPLMWTALIFLLGSILIFFSEKAFYYITNNTGFILGNILGCVSFVWNFLFNKKTKYDMRGEYLEFVEKYRIVRAD